MGEWIKASQREALGTIEHPMRRRVLENFLYSIRNLYFQRENIRGSVAILGSGPQIPEVTLVCSEETRYRIPKSSIASLTLVDRLDFSEGMDRYFFVQQTNKLRLPIGKLAADLQIGFVNADISDFLQHIPTNSLDTILMFRLPDLISNIFSAISDGRTVRENLNRCLKTGGRLIGSAAVLTQDSSEVQDLIYKHWKLNHFELLPNPAPSGNKLYEFTNHHAGFAIVKK